MAIHRTARVVFAAVACLMLASCLPVKSRFPVGTTAGFKPDAALIGLWRAEADLDPSGAAGDIAYVHFAVQGEFMTALLVARSREDNAGEWTMYLIKAATVGGRRYMNATEIASFNGGQVKLPAPGADPVPLLYAIEGRTATVSLIGEDAAKKAVQSKAIAGSVTRTGSGTAASDDIVLTADPRSTDRFFATDAGAALFSEKFLTLTKIE